MFKNFLFCLSVVTLVGCSSLEGTSHELLPKAQTKKPTINLSDKKKIAITVPYCIENKLEETTPLKNLNLKFFANDTMLKEHNIPINMKLEQNEEYCQKVKFFINTEKNPTAASILLNSMFEKHIRLDSTLSFDDEYAMPTTTSITGIIK